MSELKRLFGAIADHESQEDRLANDYPRGIRNKPRCKRLSARRIGVIVEQRLPASNPKGSDREQQTTKKMFHKVVDGKQVLFLLGQYRTMNAPHNKGTITPVTILGAS